MAVTCGVAHRTDFGERIAAGQGVTGVSEAQGLPIGYDSEIVLTSTFVISGTDQV